jgi:tripartite-type tricarboxylate transporter receptor subunit TctC
LFIKGKYFMKISFFITKFVSILAVISFNFLLFSPVQGLDYPTKPINLVVSVTAGGPGDVHARILAEAASKELGVPIVITNKGGGAGALAASFVANEKPDGYTFLVTQSGTMTSNFALYPNLSYKRTDLVPVFRSIIVPCNFAVKIDAPWKSFQDFIDAVKKNPGKLRLGVNSANISLIWEGLSKQEGFDVTRLMYKGAADSLYALMGGHVDILADPLTAMVPHVEAGKIRLLASISSKRNKHYPDVPTLYELGYHDFSKDLWNGFYAPAGLPQPIMDKFVWAFYNVISQPNVQIQLEKIGVFASFMGPKEFGKLVDDEYKFYMEIATQKK